jgi:carboxyl-terminal processing protease
MKKIIASILIFLTLSLGLFSFSPKDHYFEIARNLDIFATLYKELNVYYVDDINPSTVIKKGIDAMLKNLDPYTVYIAEDDIEDYRTMATGEYGGVGALTGSINGDHVVLMIYKGYPAFEAGLKIGDIITTVDGVDVTTMTNDQMSKLLKGQSDTKTTLVVKRYGLEKSVPITLERKNIKINSVVYSGMLDETTGFIKLSEFNSDCSGEVLNAFKELKKSGAQKLVLDLRDNPGGLLHESVNICNIFVPKGEVVVDTKGKIKDLNKTYKTLDASFDENIPLAILISSSSASASEIVAGVIQDYDRGVIIGQKSFGKGLVQATRPLSYNSQLKITTAKYYTPSGRCIQTLDYSHRNSDGSVGAVPDSLKKAFITANGRKVFDGGGIDPDITVSAWTPAAVVSDLAEQGIIFSFATKFAYENDSIPSARVFKVSDQLYNEFKAYAKANNFKHSTKTKTSVETLIASAKTENYFSALETSLNALEKNVSNFKDNSLDLFATDIKMVLEEEIVSRYYFENGVIEATFKYDDDVKKALEVLSNKEKYNSILQKK